MVSCRTGSSASCREVGRAQAMTRALKSLVIGGGWLVANAVPVAATHSLGPTPTVPLVAADYVNGVLAAREPIRLIDLRPSKDYEVSRLPQARSIPLAELRNRNSEIPRVGLVVLYCTCEPGGEWHGCELLQVRGCGNVVVLAGC